MSDPKIIKIMAFLLIFILSVGFALMAWSDASLAELIRKNQEEDLERVKEHALENIRMINRRSFQTVPYNRARNEELARKLKGDRKMGFFETLKRKTKIEIVGNTYSAQLEQCTPQDEEGKIVKFVGWDDNSTKWSKGDVVVFKKGESSSPYKVTEIKQHNNTRITMYFMTGEYAPRNEVKNA